MDTAIGFIDEVMELLGPFGTVSGRAFAGGHGIHLDGLLIALVVDEQLWLKTDTINRAEFVAAGSIELDTTLRARDIPGGFFSAPEGSLDSAQALMPWARSAYAAAMRSGARRRASDGRTPSRTAMTTRSSVRPSRGGARQSTRTHRDRHR